MSFRIAISIALVAALVNGAQAVEPKSFQKFVERLKSEPVGVYTKTDIADNLGLERGAPSHGLTVQAEDSVDDQKHMADLIFKDDKPLCVVFNVKRKEQDHADAKYYRVSLSGRLERAMWLVGKYDQNGHAIKGSGTVTPLNVKTQETKAGLKHEMDFWLKGLYRRPKAETPSSGS